MFFELRKFHETLREQVMSPSTDFGIIQSAIDREKDAETFYRSAASLSKYPEVSTLFMELAEEETNHQKLLEELQNLDTLPESSLSITGTQISLSMMDLKFHKEMTYQEVLTQAIKFEENAFNLYRTWEGVVRNPTQKKFFAYLAAEEAKHKYHLESIYNKKFVIDHGDES